MLNIDKLNVVEPLERNSKSLKINILENGKINLNGRLNEMIGCREQEIRLSPDGNVIVLIPNGERKQKFPKSGSLKNENVLRIMRKTKKKFPITYNVMWNEIQGIWIGQTFRVNNMIPDK